MRFKLTRPGSWKPLDSSPLWASCWAAPLWCACPCEQCKDHSKLDSTVLLYTPKLNVSWPLTHKWSDFSALLWVEESTKRQDSIVGEWRTTDLTAAPTWRNSSICPALPPSHQLWAISQWSLPLPGSPELWLLERAPPCLLCPCPWGLSEAHSRAMWKLILLSGEVGLASSHWGPPILQICFPCVTEPPQKGYQLLKAALCHWLP